MGFELHSGAHLDDLVAKTFAEGAGAWLSLWRQMLEVPTGTAERLANSDAKSRHALRLAEATWPSLVGTPEKIAVPVLFYAGGHCFFREATADMENQFRAGLYGEHRGRNHFKLMTELSWITRIVIDSFEAPPAR